MEAHIINSTEQIAAKIAEQNAGEMGLEFITKTAHSFRDGKISVAMAAELLDGFGFDGSQVVTSAEFLGAAADESLATVGQGTVDQDHLDQSADTVFEMLKAAGSDARSGSDIPAHLQEQFESAIVTLQAVCPSLNPADTIALGLVGSMARPGAADDFRRVTLETTGRTITPYKAAKMVQQRWMDMANSEISRIGRVTWSLDEPTPTDPMLCFVNLDPSSRYFEAGEREVAIIAYYPSTTKPNLNIRTQEWEERASWYDRDGYTHIVGWVCDEEDADSLISGLRQAMSTVQKVRVATAYREDPVRGAIQLDSERAARPPKVAAF